MTILGAIPLDIDNVAEHLFDDSQSVTIDLTTGRSGGNSLRCGNVNADARKNINVSTDTLFVAFAFRPSAMAWPFTPGSSLLNFKQASSTQVTITINADGSLGARRGNASDVLLGNTVPGVISLGTQHIEVGVTIHDTVGSVSIWVDSVQVLNLTLIDTDNTGVDLITSFHFNQGLVPPTYISDIVWGTTRIGDVRVECKGPNGAGHYAQFTPNVGVNWQCVDDIPPDENTTYNETSGVGNKDTFVHAGFVSAPVSISAILVNVRARNTTTGVGSAAPMIRVGSTDSVGTTKPLNVDFQDFQSVYETDPTTGLAWASKAAVNAVEVGYTRIT